jgi:MFS family permease
MDGSTPKRGARSGLRHTLGLLSDRNCRRWFGGKVLHNVGLRIWWAAELWLIVTLTGSGLAVGVTVAAQYLPVVLLAPWAGVLADRGDQRRRLMRAQVLLALVAGMLCTLVLTGAIAVWMVFVLAVMRGAVTIFISSSGRTFQAEVVGEAGIERGVAVNDIVWQSSAVIGPALAGVVMRFAGVGAALVLVVLCASTVLPALAAIDVSRLHMASATPGHDGRLRVAVREVRALPALWIPLLALGIVATFAGNIDVLMPLLASETWEGDVGTYGLLTTTFGIGLVLGALLAAARARASLGLIAASTTAWGVACVLAAVAPALAVQLAALLMLGVADGVFTFAIQAQLQRATAPWLRGRVSALYDLVGAGITPAGDPLVGGLAQAAGPRAGLLFQAAAAFVAAGVVVVSGRRWRRRPER